MTHVLVVDDIEDSRYLLRSVLEGQGFAVTEAINGLDALASARRARPDVIVSDAMMPGMDGFALCRAWMQDDSLRLIPFVFYSATYTSIEDEQLALALGAVRYLIKPQEPDAFVSELKTVLREWAQRPAPDPAASLDENAFRDLYQSTVVRKLDAKLLQVRAMNEQLSRSEHNYRLLFEANPLPMWVFDLVTLRFLAVNDAAVSHYGYSREEFLAMTIADIRPAEDVPRLLESIASTQQFRADRSEFWCHRKRDGMLIKVKVTSHALEFEGRPARMVLADDVTQRLQNEHELQEREQRFRATFEQAAVGMAHVTLDGRWLRVNQKLCEIVGYTHEELLERTFLDITHPDDRARDLEQRARLLAAEIPFYSIEKRYLRKGGTIIWVKLTLTLVRKDSGEPDYLMPVVEDISERRRGEEKIAQYVEQLKSAFMSTVEVATVLSEMRDPYTAGHERRVSKIAAAIGAELGWDAQQQEGLRVAGYLHDIGKITIPAEILAKPGELNALEYQLIQGHAQASYEVLKNVQFPWPVAEAVLQHHERLDGSGYPQGLRGDAISVMARILAVADVVEAMASHRPYRAALGMTRALAEIERGRGSTYDPAAVDACLRLFRQNPGLLSDRAAA